MPQIIVNGLLIGGVYALIAVGLTMIHGVMKIVNFAQGEFLAIGMYLSYLMYKLLPQGSVPYWLLLPIAVAMFFIGTIIFRTTVSRVVGKGDSNYILLTIGLSYLIQNGLQILFGSTYLSLPVSDHLKYGTLSFGQALGVSLTLNRVVAFAAATAFVIFINFFLSKTDLGRAMRATSESTTVAQSLGVNTKLTFTVAFGIGTMFAGISGLLITPMFLAYPQVGATFSVIAMSSMVLGGLGNIRGAMIGGLIIGLVESFTSTMISLDLAPIAINLVLMLVLIFKPFGLFGKGGRTA